MYIYILFIYIYIIYIYIYYLYVYIYIYIYIYIHMVIMTEYTSSENVSITIFFNLFSSTHCSSYSNKIKYFFMLQY